MGAETAILAGLLTGLNEANTARQRSRTQRHARAEHKRRQQLLDEQLSERKRNLEAERKTRAAQLRARYGASGVGLKSGSVRSLLSSLHSKADTDIQALQRQRSLRRTNLLETGSRSHVHSFLSNLQRFQRV